MVSEFDIYLALGLAFVLLGFAIRLGSSLY